MLSGRWAQLKQGIFYSHFKLILIPAPSLLQALTYMALSQDAFLKELTLAMVQYSLASQSLTLLAPNAILDIP
jgi:hypothetical protein